MPGGIRDQMGEALQSNDIAVADIGRDGLGRETKDAIGRALRKEGTWL